MSRTKIRVLRVQSRVVVGGPALNTILLSAHLDPERYETLLVGGRLEPGEKSMAPFAADKGVKYVEIPEMGRSVRWADDLRALGKMIRLIRRFKPQVVHTHTAKAGAIGRMAAFLCRVPVRVHTFHGHVFHGYFPKWKTRIFMAIERSLARLSHRIVAISGLQKQDLTERYRITRPHKCQIVPLGFELAKIVSGERGRFRAQLGIAPETYLVGIVARLAPIKNHELLLEAVALWRDRNPECRPEDARFVIVGDGECREALEQLTRDRGLSDFVVFAGWQSDTPSIFADLDLNVLVSHNEGTPVSLIEGLSCGLPILTTDVGGIRDFADEDCGSIVASDISPAEFSEHLERILAAPRARLGDAVVRRIRERFDVSRLVADVDALYQELLKP